MSAPRASRRPLQAAGLLLAWAAVTLLFGAPLPEGASVADLISREVARQLVAASLLLALAWAGLRWRGIGGGPPRPGWLRLCWLPGLYLLLFAGIGAAQGLPPAPVVAILLVNTVLVGFSEEVMFRGFLYSGLRDRLRPWPAIWAVTLLFGALHTLNALVTGHLLDALQQSGNATLIGLALLAIRLRTGSIWPAVLVHASWDFGLLLLAQASGPPPPDLQLSLAQRALATLPILPLGLWGLWLLRGVGRDGDGLGPPARRWHQTAPARVGGQAARSVMQQGVRTMADASQIREHAEVIGADGVHIGTVDKVEGDRIKLTKQDSGLGHTDHHHYLPLGLVAEVEGDTVRLSANAAVAAEMFEEEEDGKPLD